MSGTAAACLLTGAGGYVGSAVCRALTEAGSSVVALCRSDASAIALADAGVEIVRGGLADAGEWLPALKGIDTVVHTACSFGPGMAAEDRAFLAALAACAGRRDTPLRLVYTGGCWLYGATRGHLAQEADPYDPPPAWRGMIENRNWIAGQNGLDVVTVHPAMVWDEAGGALAPFIDAAKSATVPAVYGDIAVRWPFVHRDDLAGLYVMIARKEATSADYNAAGDEMLGVADVARAVGRQHGSGLEPCLVDRQAVMAERGDWAEGFALDQGMSARRARDEFGWNPERTLAAMLNL